jgi:large subunit ribosomal protein L4
MMAQLDIYNLKREKVGKVDLDDSVFSVEVREHLYYEVVRMQQANKRQGTACTKTRGELAYSTAKMFKQKGTGNARRGSRRAAGLRGGGTVFGPRPRDFGYRVPRTMRKAALRSALSGRIAEQRVFVLEDFELPEIKTKGLIEVLRRFELKNALIVDSNTNEVLKKSAKNLKNVKFLATDGLNVYDVLKYDTLIVTKTSVEAIEGALKK